MVGLDQCHLAVDDQLQVFVIGQGGREIDDQFQFAAEGGGIEQVERSTVMADVEEDGFFLEYFPRRVTAFDYGRERQIEDLVFSFVFPKLRRRRF